MFRAFLWLSLIAPANDDPFELTAVVGPRTEAGQHELRVDFRLAEGWSTPRNALLPASAPAALLQLDVPSGLRPAGRPVTNLQEHLQAFFLDVPYEHLLDTGSNSISLEAVGELEPGAALGMNLLFYAMPDGSEAEHAARLVRRRYQLSLEDGELREASPDESSWGVADFLQLGAQAAAFDLPTPAGSVRLPDVLGEGYVVVTTQRSCL